MVSQKQATHKDAKVYLSDVVFKHIEQALGDYRVGLLTSSEAALAISEAVSRLPIKELKAKREAMQEAQTEFHNVLKDLTV